MKKIYCIYPQDSTTDFLEKIPEELSSFFEDRFQLIRIEPNDKAHERAFQLIKESDEGSIFIFIGHGNSGTLKGAEIEGLYCNDDFISNEKMSVFNGKSLFLLACRSVELLDVARYTTDLNIKESISFPNIISSDVELKEERKKKKDLYPGISNEQIDTANSILVSSVIYALKGLGTSADFKHIYVRLIQHLNQCMVDLVWFNPTPVNRELADMIYHMKSEIKFAVN